MLWVPMLGAGLAGVVAAGLLRPGFRAGRSSERGLQLLAPPVLLAVFIVVGRMLSLHPRAFSGPGPGRVLAVLLVVLAAALAFMGSRLHARAELLLTSRPAPLDEALEALRQGRRPRARVLEGRLGAAEPVTSPGGVVCAFFCAELRERRGTGPKGPVLARETGYSTRVVLKGEQGEASVDLAPDLLLAPVKARPCRWGPEPGGLQEVLIGGSPPGEALSFERVGKLNERCLVVGTLREGPVPGRYVIEGPAGGPVLIALGQRAPTVGQSLARRAWAFFGGSAGLSALAAFLLARGR